MKIFANHSLLKLLKMRETKIILLFVHELVIPFAGAILSIFANIEFTFYVMLVFSFMPELGLMFSKNFRVWIREGVENGNGKLSSKDIRYALSHYAALNCIRIFTISASAAIFAGIKVPEIILTYSFAGAIGIESLMTLKTIFNPNK